jgi:hypothetical protein
MGLADDLAQVAGLRSANGCGVVALYERLDNDDRKMLQDKLETSTDVPATAIGLVLRAHGYRISDRSLQRHRKGACGCVSV